MKICVYCSASSSVNKIYSEQVELFGHLLTKHGFSLVYGGDSVGLMGRICEKVLEGNGKVIGVIPRRLHKPEIPSEEFEDFIITEDVAKRERIMREKADAFVGFPGGFGTVGEVLQTLSLKQLGYHNKPIVLVNINNYFKELIDFIGKAYKEKFIKLGVRPLYHVVDDVEHVFKYLKE